jgi:integrase/recombinase XerD
MTTISSNVVRHKPARPKRHSLVPIERLFGLGLGLMARAETETTSLRRFKTYRDGLMIGLLASRPMRLGNLTGLILDRTLVQRGNEWWIQIPAFATMTKGPIELPWPKMLALHLETYLADHRSGVTALRGSGAQISSDALWLSIYGLPMANNAIHGCIVARTREGLGRPVNPQLFRHCAVASIAIHDPAHIGIAPRLLGHRIGSTTGFCTGLEISAAVRHFDKTILQPRGESGTEGTKEPKKHR